MDDETFSDREAVILAIGILSAALSPLNQIIEAHDGRPEPGEYGRSLDEIVKTCKKVDLVIRNGLKKTKALIEKKKTRAVSVG